MDKSQNALMILFVLLLVNSEIEVYLVQKLNLNIVNFLQRKIGKSSEKRVAEKQVGIKLMRNENGPDHQPKKIKRKCHVPEES
jgi:hypothetical protein